MANQILAVHLAGSHVALAIAHSTLRSLRVSLVASLDAASDAVRDIIGSRRWDRVVASVPADLVAFRQLDVPFHDRRRLTQAVGPMLEGHVPFSLDDGPASWDYCGSRRSSSVLAALAPRAALDRHRAALAGIGVRPDRLLWAPSAVIGAYRRALGDDVTCTTIELGIDGVMVATLEHGELAALRLAGHVDDETTVRNAAWLLRTVDGAPERTVVGGARADVLIPALRAALPGSRLETLPERCPVEITETVGSAWRGAAAVIGLVMAASADLGRPVIEFPVDGDGDRAAPSIDPAVRRLVPWAVAAASLFVLAGALDYARLYRDSARLESRARRIVESVLPGTGAGGYRLKLDSRAAELENRLREATGSGPTTSPLHVLAEMSAAVPAEVDVVFSQYAYDPPNVRLRGRASSFESVTRVQQVLRDTRRFKSVEVGDVRTAVDAEGVEFELTLVLHARTEPA